MTGRDLAAERNPSRNPHFRRRWHDDPLQLPDLQHLGREVAPKVVEDVGRRAISRWLDKASKAHGPVATEAFKEADAIRLKMGLAWEDLIEERSAA